MEERPMTLRAVAALVPCHPRTLRIALASAELCGRAPRPLPRPSNDHRYKFSRAEVARWLRERDKLRVRLAKPHLRWCEGWPPDMAEVQCSDQTEVAHALDLRRRLASVTGDRLPSETVDRLVLSIVNGVSEQHDGPPDTGATVYP